MLKEESTLNREQNSKGSEQIHSARSMPPFIKVREQQKNHTPLLLINTVKCL
jgi:hypothetical protein